MLEVSKDRQRIQAPLLLPVMEGYTLTADGTDSHTILLIRMIKLLLINRKGLNFIMEELKDPIVNLPRAMLIAIPIVIVFYLLVNVAYLTVLSPEELVRSEAVAVVKKKCALYQYLSYITSDRIWRIDYLVQWHSLSQWELYFLLSVLKWVACSALEGYSPAYTYSLKRDF